MGLFADWVEKKKLSESVDPNALSQQSLGGNPLSSGVEKITRGLRDGHLPSGYTSFNVLATKFGLSQPETQALMQNQVLGNRGTEIDPNRLQGFQKQFNPGQSSRITQQRPPAPPPVPQPRMQQPVA